jgi:ferritin
MVNPPGSIQSLESEFQFGLESERKVTKEIYELVDIAAKEKDYSTNSFLQWFVTEQTEEETLFQTILQKLELLGRDDKLAIHQIDQTLAAIRSQVTGAQAK